MDAGQVNLLLTGVIAFAGVVQFIFAGCLFYNAIQQRNINRYVGFLNQYRDFGSTYMDFLKEESKLTGKPLVVDDQVKAEMVNRLRQMDDLLTILQGKALGRKLTNTLNISKEGMG